VVPIELGRTVATPGALAALEEAHQTHAEFLSRHEIGDWGEVCSEDWESNEAPVREETRLLSAYTLKTDVKIWIITEWDRSVTTILLPEEY